MSLWPPTLVAGRTSGGSEHSTALSATSAETLVVSALHLALAGSLASPVAYRLLGFRVRTLVPTHVSDIAIAAEDKYLCGRSHAVGTLGSNSLTHNHTAT